MSRYNRQDSTWMLPTMTRNLISLIGESQNIFCWNILSTWFRGTCFSQADYYLPPCGWRVYWVFFRSTLNQIKTIYRCRRPLILGIVDAHISLPVRLLSSRNSTFFTIALMHDCILALGLDRGRK
jgi:hypothetical protein